MAIGRLRATLSALEADMGILDLSDAEKTVLAAATLVADEDGLFEIKHLQDHAVAAQLSSSTFFRALRTLSARGLIGRMTQEKRSAYRLIAR
jgi:predicted transcriptional regulator